MKAYKIFFLTNVKYNDILIKNLIIKAMMERVTVCRTSRERNILLEVSYGSGGENRSGVVLSKSAVSNAEFPASREKLSKKSRWNRA